MVVQLGGGAVGVGDAVGVGGGGCCGGEIPFTFCGLHYTVVVVVILVAAASVRVRCLEFVVDVFRLLMNFLF